MMPTLSDPLRAVWLGVHGDIFAESDRLSVSMKSSCAILLGHNGVSAPGNGRIKFVGWTCLFSHS